ncbi:hypothetical protein B0H66DRAFT_532742 [Apodospora peruviana]|uniref:Uncharacterized protein n=1 Tax=Apodospora peruviana TaxID=516989 RepID=A0AAE0I460_9PEZI|nr:hypothetical protein B0H66DRAFT_532742 [Apodospora peruviana]
MAMEKNAVSTIAGPIRQLFLDHGVHERFGIALLHKHMDIAPTERLVKYRHTSVPWKVGNTNVSIVDKYEGKVLPRSFRFMDGNLVRYEFKYSREHTEHPSLQGRDVDEKFLKELRDMLADRGFDQLLGLRDLDQRDPEMGVEVTEGKANIMMPRCIIPESELVPALWVFGGRRGRQV